MPTQITPNGKVGRRVDHKQQRLKLKTERDSLVVALNAWKSNTAYNADITDFATLKALYREERKALRDCMQALRVILTLTLEELSEQEGG